MDLGAIVPPASAATNTEVLTAERSDLSKVRDAAASIDPILQQVADEEIPQVGYRHRYEHNVSDVTAKVLYGNEIHGDFVPNGPGHVYTRNEARGNSQAQYGDLVNPKRGFWD